MATAPQLERQANYVFLGQNARNAPRTPVRFPGAAADGYAAYSDHLWAPIKALRPPEILSFDVGSSGTFEEHTQPSTFTFPDGSTLGDLIDYEEYRFAKKLGEGTPGTAYLIQKGGSSYVLKHITNTSSVSLKAIMKEIDMLKAVHGKWFAVQLLAAQVFDNGIAFMLFPFIPGKELFEVIAPLTQRHATPEEAAHIKYVYNTLLEGLYELHKLGIIHRDIKPENAWVPSDPAIPPFFLDFGLAVFPAGPQTMAGTLGYIRPSRRTSIKRVPAQNDNYYAMGVSASYLPHILDPKITEGLMAEGINSNHSRALRYGGGNRRSRKTRRVHRSLKK
jgi:serine/threonine protein kinase